MKNLKKLREGRHLSQAKLADYFSLSQQAIYKYENSLSEPDFDTLIRMADFFNTSTDYLIGRTDEMTIITDKDITPMEMKHLELFRKLTKDSQEQLDKFLSSVVSNNLYADK